MWNLLISAHFIEELNVQMFSVDVYGLGVWFGSSDCWEVTLHVKECNIKSGENYCMVQNGHNLHKTR